jgi:hypothetical protein
MGFPVVERNFLPKLTLGCYLALSSSFDLVDLTGKDILLLISLLCIIRDSLSETSQTVNDYLKLTVIDVCI